MNNKLINTDNSDADSIIPYNILYDTTNSSYRFYADLHLIEQTKGIIKAEQLEDGDMILMITGIFRKFHLKEKGMCRAYLLEQIIKHKVRFVDNREAYGLHDVLLPEGIGLFASTRQYGSVHSAVKDENKSIRDLGLKNYTKSVLKLQEITTGVDIVEKFPKLKYFSNNSLTPKELQKLAQKELNPDERVDWFLHTGDEISSILKTNTKLVVGNIFKRTPMLRNYLEKNWSHFFETGEIDDTVVRMVAWLIGYWMGSRLNVGPYISLKKDNSILKYFYQLTKTLRLIPAVSKRTIQTSRFLASFYHLDKEGNPTNPNTFLKLLDDMGFITNTNSGLKKSPPVFLNYEEILVQLSYCAGLMDVIGAGRDYNGVATYRVTTTNTLIKDSLFNITEALFFECKIMKRDSDRATRKDMWFLYIQPGNNPFTFKRLAQSCVSKENKYPGCPLKAE